MFELPDELWNLIKEFALPPLSGYWNKIHRKKLHKINNFIENQKFGGSIYERWTYPPPVWQNTNDIIMAEYHPLDLDWAPRPNLPLTTITWNIKGNGGWWCGYGWYKFNWRDKNVL
tara:strand:- start:37 stop:384 length:348 start_codon:yes stop_codon:yes gene_type:complete